METALPTKTARRKTSKLWPILGIAVVGGGVIGAWVWYDSGTICDMSPEIVAHHNIKMLSTQLKIYEMAMMAPPSQVDGLQALVARPTSGPHPNRWRQLMQEIPPDPWGEAYQYRYPAVKSQDPYDIYSYGPDRKPGSKDDIGNWRPQ